MASAELPQGLLDQFPRERQWLLPALRAAQEALGWLSEPTLRAVGAHLRVPVSEVYGIASAYPELRLQPPGRRVVRVCTGVSCGLLGGRALLEAASRRYGVRPGETTPDGGVTLETVDCLFACSVGPLIEVDGELRGRASPTDLPDPEGARNGRGATAARVTAGLAGGRATGTPRERWAALAEAAGRQSRPALRFLVSAGTCGRAVGADAVVEALRADVQRRGLDAEVVAGGCDGTCYAAPAVAVVGAGPRFVVERLRPAAAAAFVELIASDHGDFRAAGFGGVVWADAVWRGLAPASSHPFWRHQERVLMARAGLLDPESLTDALRHGAYAALAEALEGPPEAVVAAVKAAGLQGRGGAFYPAALKWEACARTPGEPRYLVLNGEEGEPGIFKDRHLLEADPHLVLEGVLLAAYAARASRAILYVHGEAELAARRLARAVSEAERAGLAGPRILGTPFSCQVEMRRGAGGFVLGEETALLESIEGRRPQPRPRPPFPVESGLWGRPTVVNNVETLAAVPAILRRGAGWFAGLGTPRGSGTKLFGLSGPLVRPGVVEVRQGATLRTLVHDIGGGLVEGRRCLGALLGGPSGIVVPAARFDEPLEPRGALPPGTGGVVALPEGTPVGEIIRQLVAFNAGESCGKCTPCREGLPRLLALLDELPTTSEVEDRVRALGETIRLASLCGLGQAAPLAVLHGLDAFADQLRGRP
jgi:NADH:ubiquinone oxidoreductase subunit F (NADH-binding)/NADH:ubiquinone oxidoreductase subunit E